MPYISANLSQKLPEDKIEVLKTEIGKSISLIGKSEQHLMVDIEDGKVMFFKGNIEPCAYIDIRIYGSCDYERKNKFTEKLCDIVERIAGIEKENVFVSFLEFPNWGMSGSLV